MENENARLLDTAASVADGTEVDWLDLQSLIDDDGDRRLLEQLRVLAGIADVHRSTPEEMPSEREFARLRERVIASGAQPDASEGAEEVAQAVGAWGHLELLEQVGDGTFGEVYRAHDTQLDRDVALKLFRADAAGSARLTERVSHEGRILARVRHPNVVTVYGVEEHSGRVGLWMEFVRGKTLEALLARQGPFSAREAAVIGQDLCRAVASVQRAGLLHRDIKAQNVMREHGGRVVLMDFGAGCLLGPDTLPQLGGTTGTPMYLAPEVLSGEADASVESDLYSLGVLLYHLVTQSYPVRATSIDGLRAAHLSGTRTRLHDARPDLTDGFVTVVERAMHPDPRRRYHSAGELQSALAAALGVDTSSGRHAVPARLPDRPVAAVPDTRRGWATLARPAWLHDWRGWAAIGVIAAVVAASAWAVLRRGGGGAAGSTPLLVVRPLEPTSPEDQYLAAGLTSALFTTLGRLDVPVDVASPSAVAELPDNAPAGEVLRRLRADVLAEGGVHQQPDGTAEATIRLTRAGATAPFWNRTFTRPRVETPRLQDDIAAALVDALRVRPRSRARAASRVLPDAYDAYLRGRYALTQRRPDDAVSLLNQARNLQPDFAAAYAALGQAYLWQSFTTPRSDKPNLIASAREASRQALLLDPDLGEAYGVLADISFVEEWDWAEADAQFKRALELNPTDETVRFRYALFLAARRRVPEGLVVIEEGRRLNPLSAQLSGYAAFTRYLARDHRGAIREFRHALTLDPSYAYANQGLCRVYRETRQFANAVAQCQLVVDEKAQRAASAGRLREDREWHSLRAELAVALAGAGRRAEAQAILGDMLSARAAWPDAVMPESIAFVQMALGQNDRAFEWLDRAIEERSRPILYLAVDPRFDPIRSHPRYATLVSRLGLPTSPS